MAAEGEVGESVGDRPGQKREHCVGHCKGWL